MTTLTLDATQLRRAWPRIKKAVPRKSTLPILGALTLSRVNDDLIRITTHGVESLSLTTYISGEADSDEPIYLWWDALDAALTKAVCELTFTVIENTDGPHPDVKISGGSRELTVTMPPSEDLPEDLWVKLKDADQQAIATLTKPQAEAVKAYVLGAAATDDARPVLAGIHITVKDGHATFAAADGYRMGLYTVPTEYQGDVDIISMQDVFQLWTAVPDCAMIFEPVSFSPENSDNPIHRLPVFFQSQGISYLAIVREIDGKYPDLEQIVPDEDSMLGVAHVSRESILDLADAARSSNDVVRLKSESIEATTHIQGREPSTVSWTNGHIKWEPLQHGQGPSPEYAFNGRYLKWAVAGDNELPIMVNGPNQGALVHKRIGGGELSLVIMPMAIGGS